MYNQSFRKVENMKINIIIVTFILIMTLTGCSKKNSHKEASLGDLQFITNNADYYENGVVFGNDTAMFLDFNTMEKAPLCAVPNCTHTTSECLSNMVGYSPIFYNDYVYFFSSNNGVNETVEGPEFYINSKLMKASLDSSATEIVCEFHDSAPPDSGLVNYVRYKNELYFVGDNLNPEKDEYGNYSWSTVGGQHFLCSINLDTGIYTNYGSIYDGDKKYKAAAYSSHSFITGIYKNKMNIAYVFVEDFEELNSGDFEFTYMNFEFDFETKTWKESELPYSRYMNDNTYTYYDFENKYFNVIYKDKDLKFPFDYEITVCSEFNGKLFLPLEGKWFDLSDSSEHFMGKYTEYEVVGYKDGCYILIKGGITAKITEEELLSLDKEQN